MIDKNEIAIIIQGPSINVEGLRQQWIDFNVIWSTWVGEEGKYRSDDIVIFNNQHSIMVFKILHYKKNQH